MDEFDLVRRAVDDPPPDLAPAMDRARARLRGAIEQEKAETPPAIPRSKRRRRIWWIPAAAAVIAVAALMAQSLLPSGSGGPPLSAAGELSHLGQLAASQESLELGPGSYLYTKVLEDGRNGFSILGGPSYVLVVRETLETWLAADGSGRQITTIQRVRFASAADKSAWRKSGSPSIPKAGSKTEDRYRSAELPYYNVNSLPTDPDQLVRALGTGQVIQAPKGDAALLSTLGLLLAQGNASPALRQGLFQAASRIPSVTLNLHVTDLIGRTGVGVSLISGGSRTELLFDPGTSQILAISKHLPGTPVTDWQAFVSQAVVGSISARPQKA